jgi:putative thiamine transport system ATP-binding protein
MGLRLESLSVSLPDRVLVKPFTLAIAPGEIVLLMGASGAGKSSLLAAIGGDLAPPLVMGGKVCLDDSEVTALPPEARRIGRLYQDDLLFPHLNVGENLLFGVPRRPRAERLALMQDALRQAGLEGFAARNPATLSGGQRARVALFRALLAAPRAMLLDEPFGRLDQGLRAAQREIVYGHLAARRIACLVVSHDPADAAKGGRVLQLSPRGEVGDA